MADSTLPGLGVQLGSALAIDDTFLVNDLSDTTQGAPGSLKNMIPVELSSGLRRIFSSVSTARVMNGAGATDTYMTGSAIAIPAGYPAVGTRYKCKFDMAKTAAGVLTPTVIVRIGTAGSTADSNRLQFVFGAGTAVAEKTEFELDVSFRTVGSGTSAILAGCCTIKGHLSTTGMSNGVRALAAITGLGFDSTVSNLIIGVSFNGGTAFVGTSERCVSDLIP